MEVAAGSGDGSVAEGRLDQVDRGGVVQGVAGVGVTEPVRRDVLFEAGASGGGVDDAADLRGVETAPAAATAEDGFIRWRGGALERKKPPPEIRLQQNASGAASFTEDGDLTAILAGQGIWYFECSGLGEPLRS